MSAACCSARPRRRLPAFGSVLPAVGLALLPKCPICWAALMAATGVAGLSAVPYQPWLLPALGVLLVASLVLFWIRGAGRSRGPFWLGAAGAVLTLAGRFLLTSEPVALAGVALIGAAAVWSAIARRRVPAGFRGAV